MLAQPGRFLCPCSSKRGQEKDRVEVEVDPRAQKEGKEKGEGEREGEQPTDESGSWFVKVKSKQSLRSPGR